MRARGRRAAAGTVALLLTAAACSSSPPPRAGPTASSAVSTSSAVSSSAATSSAVSSSAATRKSSSAAPASARRQAPRATASPSTRTVPSSPATVPSNPASVRGRTIALNPGHNGGNAANSATINRPVPSGFGRTRACDTTGTTTNAGYPEHAFNWDVTVRVKALLQARGVNVVLTRSSDTGVGPCIDERAQIGNQPGAAAVVSIHADGAPANGHGFHICEDSRQPAGPAVAARSHSLTVAVHDALLNGSGLTTSTYLGNFGYFPRDDLAGLNLATVPATFIELGNMRNAADAALQTSPAGRTRIATAIAAGIFAWLG